MPSPTTDPLSVLVRAIARTRVAIARRPHLYWIAIGVVASAAALGVRQELRQVDAARASWGASRQVLVVTRPIDAGEELAADSIEHRVLPVAAVPDSALEGAAAGLVALHPLAPGEVLLDHHVSSGTGLGGRLPEGTAGVVVSGVASALSLDPGDLVDVVSIDDPLGGAGPPAGTVLATGATVISIAEDGVVIAVPADVAPTAAAAVAGGRAVLVLARSVAG